MSKYANMFDSAPPAPKPNLFGEVKTSTSVLDADIEAWRAEKGINTSLNRIKYLLEVYDVSKITMMKVAEIGARQIGESTEANKLVDTTVNEFALLKPQLEGPKQLILTAAALIEGGSKPKGWFAALVSANQAVDWNAIRTEVKEKTDEALKKMQSCIKWHVEPFLETLRSAKSAVWHVEAALDGSISTLLYIADKSSDNDVQDAARRRLETFQKAMALMQINKTQLENMKALCAQNKTFATELEVAICPVIASIVRTSIIEGDNSLQEIANKLKGIL